MRSSGKRSGAGDRVLEGRHVIGLFMLMLLFSGVFFTLGYVMGRNQYDGQVRAADGRGFTPPEVLPKRETPARVSNPRPAEAEPASDNGAPASSDWEFYHAGDSNKTEDHLRPAQNAPSQAPAKGGSAARQVNAASKTSAAPPLGASGGINLQVAALRTEADAMALANNLRRKNFPTFVQPPQRDKYYHVLVGPYADQKSADTARKGLEAAGFNKVLVKR